MTSVKLSLLEQKHNDYDLYFNTWDTIADLKEGAYALLRNPAKYCPKRTPDEDEDIYQMRLKKFSYTPVMSNAVREFVSKLSSAPLHITNADNAFWTSFRDCTNGSTVNRKDEQDLLNDLFSHMLYYGRVHVAVDTPQLLQIPRSAYELNKANVLPYVTVFDPRHVINWGDDYDWFVTKLYYQRSQPLQLPVTVCRWTVWTSTVVQVYEVECRRNGWDVLGVKVSDNWLTNRDEAEVQLVTEWYHNLNRCPVSTLVLPSELWTGNNVYLKQLQHTMIESGWSESGSIAGTIQRVFTPTEAPPIDDPRSVYEQPDYSQELSKIGNQYVLIGKDYRVVESTGAAIGSLTNQLSVIESQIKDLVSMRFASINPTKGAVEQSGTSKDIDMTMLQDAMKTYGSKVVSLYNDVLMLVANVAGQEVPTVSGLDSYSSDTLADMLTQSMELASLPIPATALKVWFGKLTNLLTGSVSPDDEEVIQEELQELFNSGTFNTQVDQISTQVSKETNKPLKPATQLATSLKASFGLSDDEIQYVLGRSK